MWICWVELELATADGQQKLRPYSRAGRSRKKTWELHLVFTLSDERHERDKEQAF